MLPGLGYDHHLWRVDVCIVFARVLNQQLARKDQQPLWCLCFCANEGDCVTAGRRGEGRGRGTGAACTHIECVVKPSAVTSPYRQQFLLLSTRQYCTCLASTTHGKCMYFATVAAGILLITKRVRGREVSEFLPNLLYGAVRLQGDHILVCYGCHSPGVGPFCPCL